MLRFTKLSGRLYRTSATWRKFPSGLAFCLYLSIDWRSPWGSQVHGNLRRTEALVLHAAPFLISSLAIEPARLALVFFGNAISGIRSVCNRTLQHGKQFFHWNPDLHLIMHFLQAALFSLAALAFTASASPASCSETHPCAQEFCYLDKECGPECFCYDGVPPNIVNISLLLVRSKLICNPFTDSWEMLPNPKSCGRGAQTQPQVEWRLGSEPLVSLKLYYLRADIF